MQAPPSDIPHEALAQARLAVVEAGRIALGSFRPGAPTTAGIRYKGGGSPVSEADLAVDRYLRDTLMAAAPGFGWLSEETEDDADRLGRDHVWVVDPIDGTRAFIRGDDDWTVAIGIVSKGMPVAGFVHAPVSGALFETTAEGGARVNGQPARVSERDQAAGARITGPRALVDAMAALAGGFAPAARVHSLALRFAQVADARFDGAVASGMAHDWDLAAVHAILEAAGATILTAQGVQPRYNRRETEHDAVVAGSPPLAHKLAALLARTSKPRVPTGGNDMPK